MTGYPLLMGCLWNVVFAGSTLDISRCQRDSMFDIHVLIRFHLQHNVRRCSLFVVSAPNRIPMR